MEAAAVPEEAPGSVRVRVACAMQRATGACAWCGD
jgi:hypothetical protein